MLQHGLVKAHFYLPPFFFVPAASGGHEEKRDCGGDPITRRKEIVRFFWQLRDDSKTIDLPAFGYFVQTS